MKLDTFLNDLNRRQADFISALLSEMCVSFLAGTSLVIAIDLVGLNTIVNILT